MAWDTTDLTNYNDIIVQDGVFAYNFEASGTIYKGQAVALIPGEDNTVGVTTSVAAMMRCIGLATYNVTDAVQVGIAGPGNICYACFDSAIAVGTAVYATTAGVFTSTQGNAQRPAGYVVSLPAIGTTAYVGKILLL